MRAEGDLDFRGTLGVAKEAPVGFRDIRLAFDLDIDASEEQLATLLKLTERYCVVYQSLRQFAEERGHHEEGGLSRHAHGLAQLVGRVSDAGAY